MARPIEPIEEVRDPLLVRVMARPIEEVRDPLLVREKEPGDRPEKSFEVNEHPRLRSEQEQWVYLRQEIEQLKHERGVQFAPPASSYLPSFTVGEALAIVSDSRWIIAGTLVFLFLVGVGYLVIAEPIYRVDALLKINKTASSVVALADISEGFKEETVVMEEIEILQSRKLLGQVVDELKLDTITEPVYFPVVGAAVARHNGRDEKVKVETLRVPADYVGAVFTLVAKNNNHYQLLDQEGNVLTEGTAGVPVHKWLPVDTRHRLLVSKIEAQPDTRFELSRIPRIEAINQLRESLKVEERGPVVEQGPGSGVVQISLEGSDRNKITNIINRIVDIFIQQEIKRKSSKVNDSLEFMQKQLPVLKEQMENAEEALNSYRLQQGAVDLAKETEIILERMVAIETDLSGVRTRRTELLQKFRPEHSAIIVVDAQIGTLQKELAALERRVKTFPDTQQQMLRLSRDRELYAQLYTFMGNRIEQLRVVKAAPLGTVRVVDRAVPPYEPVRPQEAPVIAASLVLGLFLGIGVAFLRKAARAAIQDPDIIEKKLGLPVYATVPHSRKQCKLMKGGAKQAVLAVAEPADPAVESLRSLRTSLNFVLFNAKNNVILVTGPTPGIGKSFLSVNFSLVLASAGKRVLLIDGDLRKGHIDKYLGIESKEGLSDVIVNGTRIEQVIRNTDIKDLDIVCPGTIPPNPSELLSHERFASILEKVSPLYDYVIIDSPPVLMVTDAAITGRWAGAALLVVKAGAHTLREIEQSIKRLKQGGVNVRGVVFNDMPVSQKPYGYGGYYGYAQAYSYKK
ncbi:MAG: polysaccharide biosynthesis tyrosine autokinase [Gammaproteobacteria bacterium]|nr:polysaccharide biosynthesis tyrosine autokinase [Gammaproteobacteria bacterium]